MASGIRLIIIEPETELNMSATAALDGHVRYKEQLKLMRARTAADWTTRVFTWPINALRAKPAPVEWIDEVEPARPR
jgi:hypothetical protein